MVQWEQLQEREPFNEFLGCSWLRVSLPVKQYSLSYPDCCLSNSMGKGTWGVKTKCKGRVLCVRVCGHVHAQGRMLWKRFWRCFLPHAYSRVKFLCRCTLYKCTTRRTFVSTDWFFGSWSNYFALLQVTSPLILTYLGTFQLTLGISGLSCRITASAIALETWAYLPLFCASIKGPFLSCPVTALTTMQNSKVKPEVIFASQFSYFSSHCCLGESIMVGSPVPPWCLVWDAKRPLSGEEGDCYEDIWAHAVYKSQESLLNFYIYVSKMFCKDLSRSLLMLMFQSLFFTFLEI